MQRVLVRSGSCPSVPRGEAEQALRRAAGGGVRQDRVVCGRGRDPTLNPPGGAVAGPSGPAPATGFCGPTYPVERHRPDAEFAVQLGHRRVAVRHRGLGQPHLGFRQRELPAALPPASPRGLEPGHGAASAAKMPNTRRPAAVVVSTCTPWPASTRRTRTGAGR